VPWAVTFRDSYASRTVGTPLDTPLHPTEIYEAIACLAIFFLLAQVARRKRFDGQVTLAYVLLYAIARFVIEIYRGDAVRGSVLGGWLSTSQFIAILMVIAVAVALPFVARRNRLTPPPPPAPA
jgi:phosphatidylglycerol:prolipoprotein diacylglycerol transferase